MQVSGFCDALTDVKFCYNSTSFLLPVPSNFIHKCCHLSTVIKRSCAIAAQKEGVDANIDFPNKDLVYE